jgi:hypothetical protein
MSVPARISAPMSGASAATCSGEERATITCFGPLAFTSRHRSDKICPNEASRLTAQTSHPQAPLSSMLALITDACHLDDLRDLQLHRRASWNAMLELRFPSGDP